MRALLELRDGMQAAIIVLAHAAYQIFLDNVRPHNVFLDKEELAEIENLLWDICDSNKPWEMENKVNRVQEIYNIMLMRDPTLKDFTLIGQVREVVTAMQRMMTLIKEK